MNEYSTVEIPGLSQTELQYYCLDGSELHSERFAPHMHDCLEFYLLMEGDVSFLVGENLCRLQPGDAVLSRPNEVHNCVLNKETVHKHYCFWFRSDSEFLFGDFLHTGAVKQNLLSPATERARREILDTAATLVSLYEKNEPLAEYAAMVRLLSLWHDCLGTPAKGEKLPEELQMILDDISKNLSRVHELSYFLEKYNVSSFRLRELFRKYFQMTPKAYLENRRLAYSRELLREGRSVTDACVESGFPDLSNYIRLFRTRFGMTPSQYRRADAKDLSPISNLSIKEK